MIDFKSLHKDIENCKRITNMYNDLLQQLFDAIEDDLKREEKEYRKKIVAEEIMSAVCSDRVYLKDIKSAKKEEVKLP